MTLASNFGSRTEVYNGIDVTIDARFDNGASISGGLSTGQTTTDNCAVKPDSPDSRFCNQTQPFAAQTQVKLNGVYPLPWWGLQASAVLQNIPGIPIRANLSYANAAVAPSLGRSLTGTSRVTVSNLFDPWLMREPRLTQLDLRLTKILQLGAARVQGSFDVYNLLNDDAVLALNTTFGTAWLRPRGVMGARIAKFGVQVNW